MIESVSRRAFSSTSGTYHVRASELARDRKLNIFNVTVFFLDDTHHTFQIEKKAKGHVLLEQVFVHLDLMEIDYFGLQFTENGTTPCATNTEITRWLDSNKSVKKQVGVNAQFWLAVRFYPPEPARLNEEYTRYLLCLQLRKYLMDGRMSAPRNTMLLLASFTVQAELGDFNPEATDYLTDYQLLPKQSAEDERRIKELHKLHKGQNPGDAETNFLEHAKRLDSYGVESHPAKDSNGKDIYIGVTSIGIVVFQNSIKINTFSWGKIVKISFKKKMFFIQLKREPSENYETVLGFNMRSSRASKALWRCAVERHGFFRLRAPRRRPFLGALGALAGIAAPSLVRTESQALHATRPRSANATFVRRSWPRERRAASSPGAAHKEAAAASRHRVAATDAAPREAWTDDHTDVQQEPREEGSFLERVLRVPLSYVDESDPSDCDLPNNDSTVVKLSPGADGRFGFNVRGGGGAPVLVSRVAARTTTLQEGDQVISINNMDVEDFTHEQIVQLIRTTRGVLTLVVKPNAVYEPEDPGPEEPAVCFVPLGSSQSFEGDLLEQSMLLLGDGLASGAALRQYDTLTRKLDIPSNCAKLPQNLAKNRYRDIMPYDSTRVILKNSESGDYINASYINMEIPNSNLVLTYIATQGPLPNTVGDFWQMVWESDSSLIVMLTVLSERGRAKCHQYWPKVGGGAMTVTDTLTVTTNSENCHGHYVRREMTLKESDGGSRRVRQLQYVSWPDHGAPDDPARFIAFTRLCAKLRNHNAVLPTMVSELNGEDLLDPPMIVHCSAGVGRTGALILAETALELIERRQPLYPLDLVRVMRTQRPMCIQNVSQYKFVCESIQNAYAKGITRSSPDPDIDLD